MISHYGRTSQMSTIFRVSIGASLLVLSGSVASTQVLPTSEPAPSSKPAPASPKSDAHANPKPAPAPQRTASAEPDAPTAPPPAGAIVVGLATQKAKLLNAPQPVYPPLAKSAKVQGVCRFNVLVSESGAVSDVKLVRGHPLLVNAAKEAVRQYRYQKTVIDGVEKKVWTMVDVNFDLSR